MEVLSALQHAELRLGHQFTKEEFVAGQVGNHMIPEDFDQEKTVSKLDCLSTHLDFLNMQACSFKLAIQSFTTNPTMGAQFTKHVFPVKFYYALGFPISTEGSFFAHLVLLRTYKLLRFLTRVSRFFLLIGLPTRVRFPTNLNYFLQDERLLDARKTDFNKQLERLAEPIGSMLERTSKEYRGDHPLSLFFFTLSFKGIDFCFCLYQYV